jgi:hypothetical protein
MTPFHILLMVTISFAALVTIHVLGSVSIAMGRSRANGFTALLVPPFFPYLAARHRAIGWLIAWCTAVAFYAVAIAIAIAWR